MHLHIFCVFLAVPSLIDVEINGFNFGSKNLCHAITVGNFLFLIEEHGTGSRLDTSLEKGYPFVLGTIPLYGIAFGNHKGL